MVEPLDAEGERLPKAGARCVSEGENSQANPKKRVEASDFFKGYELLRKLKGTLIGLEVIFGAAKEYQMIFKPQPDGTMRVGCASAIGA